MTGAAGSASRWAALAALALMAGWSLRNPTVAAWIAALPLAALCIAGAARLAYWAIATGIVMLPYFCYGVMLVVTEPASRGWHGAFTVLTLLAFFGALDSLRRSQRASAVGVQH